MAYGVDQTVILGVIAQESMFNTQALGCVDGLGVPHCFGLMQLHDRGAGYMVPPTLLRSPCFNVLLGTHYLAKCKEENPQHLSWQLACYQLGIGAIEIRGLAPSYEYVRWATWYKLLFTLEKENHVRQESSN